MDFTLDNHGDLVIENNEFLIDNTLNTRLIMGLFSDSKVGNQRGYWLDIESNKIWAILKEGKSIQSQNDIKQEIEAYLSLLVSEKVFKSFLVEIKDELFIMTIYSNDGSFFTNEIRL